MKKSLLIGLLSLLLAASTLVGAQGPKPGLVTFGDSLSDTGNLFALQRTNNTPPDYLVNPVLVPDAAYPRGGHNLSNGAPWIQVLARSLGHAPNAAPAFRDNNPRATNYAVAGARAYDDNLNVNLGDQVDRFLADFGGMAPSGALYVIEIGGSDVRDVLQFGDPGIINQGLQAIADNILRLYQAGARRFLVWNVPNIGIIPSVRALEPQFPGVSALASMLSQSFNDNLEAVLTMLGAFQGIEIRYFDLHGLVNSIYSNPGDFGLAEVNAPCITPGSPPYACKNPDDYLFWDGLHPTRAVHAIVAQQVAAVLAQ